MKGSAKTEVFSCIIFMIQLWYVYVIATVVLFESLPNSKAIIYTYIPVHNSYPTVIIVHFAIIHAHVYVPVYLTMYLKKLMLQTQSIATVSNNKAYTQIHTFPYVCNFSFIVKYTAATYAYKPFFLQETLVWYTKLCIQKTIYYKKWLLKH